MISIPVLHVKSGVGGTILSWITKAPKKKKKLKKEACQLKVKPRKTRPKSRIINYEESDAEMSSDESDFECSGVKKKVEEKEPYGQNNKTALEFLKKKFGRFIPESMQAKQVNQIIQDNERFCETLSPNQKDVWLAFSDVVTGFLGKNRDPNYVAYVEKLKNLMKMNRIKCTLKVHVLINHLDKFASSNSDFSDEAGEKFHHELSLFVGWFHVDKEKLIRFLADYYWRLKRDAKNAFKRKFKNSQHF